MTWMTVTFGFIQGAGSGIVSVAVTVVIMMYFDKYRGFATGIRYAGYSLSSLLYPPVLALLDELFSFRQVLLLFGAISLHLTPLVLALKEPPWAKMSAPPKRRIVKGSTKFCGSTVSTVEECRQEERTNSTETFTPSFSVNARENILRSNNSFGNGHTYESKSVVDQPAREIKCPKYVSNGQAKLVQAYFAYSRNTITNQDVGINEGIKSGSSIPTTLVGAAKNYAILQRGQLPEASGETQTPVGVTDGDNSTSSSETTRLQETSRLRLLVNPIFWAVVLGGVLADYTDCAVMTTLVDSALDRGATSYEADLSIACSAPSQLLGRALLPLIADVGFVNRTTLACACYFLFAASIALLATYTELRYVCALPGACVPLHGQLDDDEARGHGRLLRR
ncbi:uncharacterized protein LOC125943941 [Dermacentor silvarum]|uniref:uncharacterized protein LOC125943941 n=1 Tax=Dermacentor silvarum TaxID=543639 RepID=UPI0021008EE2|nr:uncharacterized protein LOC125943941 [Dermacentor silvarum]